MAIWNLGSINADYTYRVSHLPAPGETVAATEMQRGLGGKGANMSVAAARAAARVNHIGAVGHDGAWAVERLLEYGVDASFIKTVEEPTAHALIAVDTQGENSIILFPGANHAIPERCMTAALAEAHTGDYLLMQNETTLQPEAAALAKDMGLKVAYAAAPFDAEAVAHVVPMVDLLVLNAVEMAQLQSATGKSMADLDVETVVVTHGADGGAVYRRATGWNAEPFPAHKVTPVDTTGAGDTFTGYLLAGLDRGLGFWSSIDLAAKAASIMVTRQGTADVIPDLKDIEDMFGPTARP